MFNTLSYNKNIISSFEYATVTTLTLLNNGYILCINALNLRFVLNSLSLNSLSLNTFLKSTMFSFVK
jgi:hypothetical protein